MIRVRTGSRLHFGLFSLPSEHAGPWLNQEGQPTLPRREFGGVGLMVEEPGIALTVEKAKDWTAEGPLAQRALRFANAYCTAAGITDCFAIRIDHAAPEHVGLGTGTQLGLAVAHGIAKLANVEPWDQTSARLLAKRIGRGLRSSIGIAGYELGGLIVEGGKACDDEIAPSVAFAAPPESWKVLLILPHGVRGAHGDAEVRAFRSLVKMVPDDRATEALCRLVLLGMLPAISQLDLDSFGEAVYDFNRRAGEMFRSVQGGTYAHPRVEIIVRMLRDMGVKGVGQSSWGPTVFAIVPADQINEVRAWLIRKGVAAEEITVTSARNHGAIIEKKLPV